MKCREGAKRRANEAEIDSDGEDCFETMVTRKKPKVQSGLSAANADTTESGQPAASVTQISNEIPIDRAITNNHDSVPLTDPLDLVPCESIIEAEAESTVSGNAMSSRGEPLLSYGTGTSDVRPVNLVSTQSVVQIPESPLAQDGASSRRQNTEKPPTIQDELEDQATLIVTETPTRERSPTTSHGQPKDCQVLVPCTPRVARAWSHSKILVPRTPTVSRVSHDPGNVLVPRTPTLNIPCTKKGAFYIPNGSHFFEHITSVPNTQQGGVSVNGQLVLSSRMYVSSITLVLGCEADIGLVNISCSSSLSIVED